MMDKAPASTAILKRLAQYHRPIDLSLREGYHQLLDKLGCPHKKLPPLIHVAGTNGKGSTIAFMRAMLEAAGKRVHVYTSPHLVTFHERIRLAGEVISEELLCGLLEEVEKANEKKPVTFFEITTAVAFLAFSRAPADILLLEVGMGGRLDATNVIERPLASIITRISYDHREYLGETLPAIATEKAGIFKSGAPAIIAPQGDDRVTKTLIEKAAQTNTPLFLHERDWFFGKHKTHHHAPAGVAGVTEQRCHPGFLYKADGLALACPPPSLIGPHQYDNAATAVAAMSHVCSLSENAIAQGLKNARWPARLQRLTKGPLVESLSGASELWLDGGHNDSAGAALAQQCQAWRVQDDKPFFVIYGMLASKNANEFLTPLAPYIAGLYALAIPGEAKSMTTEKAALTAAALGIKAQPCASVSEALIKVKELGAPARILITGSLYLAGHILQENG